MVRLNIPLPGKISNNNLLFGSPPKKTKKKSTRFKKGKKKAVKKRTRKTKKKSTRARSLLPGSMVDGFGFKGFSVPDIGGLRPTTPRGTGLFGLVPPIGTSGQDGNGLGLTSPGILRDNFSREQKRIKDLELQIQRAKQAKARQLISNPELAAQERTEIAMLKGRLAEQEKKEILSKQQIESLKNTAGRGLEIGKTGFQKGLSRISEKINKRKESPEKELELQQQALLEQSEIQ